MVCVDSKQNSTVQERPKAIELFEKKKGARILLADDDYEMRALLALLLLRAGYKVVECSDGWSLLEHLEGHILLGSEVEKVDLIISDIRMPGITGIEILRGLPQGRGYPPVILITAFGDKKTHRQAEQFGAAAIFDKPFEIDDLWAKVRKIVPLEN
jgi:two-component system response regulator (stage 0 sporulation protein F)